MRKLALIASIVGIAAAPFAAQADVGTSMYQPGPKIVHVQKSAYRVGSQGRAAHAQQVQSIRNGQNAAFRIA